MYPEEFRYSKEHEWVKIENSSGIFGITHYAQEQLGDVVYVELPEEGEQLEQFKPCGVIESVKAVSDIYAPLSGKVIEVNAQLQEKPELVNKDPYGEGWMLRFEFSVPQEVDNLMSAKQYQDYIGQL